MEVAPAAGSGPLGRRNVLKEDEMRAALPLALILALAGTAEAQQATGPDAIPSAQAVQELHDGPRTSTPPVQTVRPVELPAGAATTTTGEAGQQQQETRSYDARDLRQQGPTNPSWWWLVGAIVLAGLIIVALT
jgi:hypothetical protein